MDKVTQLAKCHKEWVRIVNSFGNDFLAEDIVQETYIKLIRLNQIDKVVPNDINRGLMWLSLRSVYIDHLRGIKSERVGLENVKELMQEESELDKYESLEEIHRRIESEIDKWHWYDQKLFRIYKDELKPMRQIAKETDISLTSIFHTIKGCKEKLREALGEDYEDFINEQFELI
jgi:RNA polymerase sigma factor (sigma-70 family)